jgi:hypothetical protein
MMKLIDKIKDMWILHRARKACSNLQFSAKGRCLINYLEDIVNDKDVYIEEYEQTLKPYTSEGYSREEAAKYQLMVINAMIELGAKRHAL